MQSRQTLIEMFSTFLNLSADRAQGWLTDARLQRHMQTRLGQTATMPEDFWVVYWHRQWQQAGTPAPGANRSMLSEGHLSAYLQETCYWSVQRVVPRMGRGQSPLSDCFQVAIAQVPKVLNKFDTTQRPSLKAYANRAFGNFVRDYLRQRQEVDSCSDWSLLLKVSRKRLLEALQNGGHDRANSDRILLAWTCFEATHLPTKVTGLRQITAPDAVAWQLILDRYDQERQALQPPLPATTSEQMERELLQAAKQVRTLLYPQLQSLNRPKGDEISGEVQDDLPASDQDSLLTGLIHQEEISERQQQQQQMQDFLVATIAALGDSAAALLRLYYGDQLKQQQIAQQLGIQQYTVSRQLTKARESLLRQLIQWAQTTWHILPDSNVVNSISTLLEDWLQQHYESSNESLHQSSHESPLVDATSAEHP
jgi:RNA polymerase sigma factor (sigma-70 family)